MLLSIRYDKTTMASLWILILAANFLGCRSKTNELEYDFKVNPTQLDCSRFRSWQSTESRSIRKRSQQCLWSELFFDCPRLSTGTSSTQSSISWSWWNSHDQWHDHKGPIDIAPPLFEKMPDVLLDLLKECDDDIGFMTIQLNSTLVISNSNFANQ